MAKAEKSLFDLLLEEENIIDKSKEYEVVRLTEKFGKKFIVEVTSLTDKQIEMCYESKDSDIDFILESVKIEGKSLKDKVLLDKFNVKISRDVIKKIFNNGEIRWLYLKVIKLNGLSGDTVVELKN